MKTGCGKVNDLHTAMATVTDFLFHMVRTYVHKSYYCLNLILVDLCIERLNRLLTIDC